MGNTEDVLKVIEERKNRLAAEGLFVLDRKKSIPKYPKKLVLFVNYGMLQLEIYI